MAIDQMTIHDIAPEVLGGMDDWRIAFTVIMEPKEETGEAETRQTVYLSRPGGYLPLEVFDVPPATGDQIWWSPNGTRVAYFVSDPDVGGLYVLDLAASTEEGFGVSTRILALDHLSPHGFFNPPVWSPNSSQIAITLATDWSTDIWLINHDGSGLRNVTQSGSFDMWPVWDDQGLSLYFVSDRARCPTWQPYAEGSCFDPDVFPLAPPVDSVGQVYHADVVTGKAERINDLWVGSAPKWIAGDRLSVTTGDGSTSSSIWTIDALTGDEVEISPPVPASSDGIILNVEPHWSPNGEYVIYQRAGIETELVVANRYGDVLATNADYNFGRFAFSADWSPDGEIIAVGGHNGQCPRALLLFDRDLNLIREAGTPPNVCDPLFSPAGGFLAFVGIYKSIYTDGRMDLWSATEAGYGFFNITEYQIGELHLLEWVSAKLQR
jgi:Tol biopolymer transport system component